MKSCLTMEDRGKSMGNRMTKSRVSNSNWVSNSMSKWVSNGNWVSNSMDNWVSNSMSNWVSNSMSNNSRSILRNSLIGHILDDSVSIVSVLDSLDPAVRKSDSVATRGCVTISGLTLLEACSTVVITDTILVIVHWGLSKVWGSISSRMGSNKLGSRGTGSNGEEGSSKNSLEFGKSVYCFVTCAFPGDCMRIH